VTWTAQLAAQADRETCCDPALREDCIPDSLEVVFEASGSSLLEVGPFRLDPGSCPCLGLIGNPLQGEVCDNRRDDDRDGLIDCADPDCAEDIPCAGADLCCQDNNPGCALVPVKVFLNTLSEHIRGWSFNVVHDDAVLTLLEDSVKLGASARAAFIDPGFNVTQAVPRIEDDPNTPENEAQPAGFISAIVLSFTFTTELPLGFNDLAEALYIVVADPGREGTLIRVGGCGMTVNGEARHLAALVHGRLRTAEAPPAPETCGNGRDDDLDGRADCEDSDCAGTPACPPPCSDFALFFGPAASTADVEAGPRTTVAVSMRNIRPVRAFQLGVGSAGTGDITHRFADRLRTTTGAVVELAIIDDEGRRHTLSNADLLAENGVRSCGAIRRVRRGAALMPSDRGVLTVNSRVGGGGFAASWDLDPSGVRRDFIPAAPPGGAQSCPVQEILLLEIGPQRSFRRGDANGNGRFDVGDVVLIIQVALGNLPERFDCDDVRDTNDDGQAIVTDAVPLLTFLFRVGPPLPDPFLTCGVDPSDNDGLGCAQASPACP
jgi:hypothetical protein